MKIFSIFVLAVFLLSILTNIFSSPDAANNHNEPYTFTSLSSASTDSNNQNFILYYTRHHGYNWSKVYRDSIGLFLSEGTTRNWCGLQTWPPFDTLGFIENNIQTITWGLDSLWKEAKQLKPLFKQTIILFIPDLYIISFGLAIVVADIVASPPNVKSAAENTP